MFLESEGLNGTLTYGVDVRYAGAWILLLAFFGGCSDVRVDRDASASSAAQELPLWPPVRLLTPTPESQPTGMATPVLGTATGDAIEIGDNAFWPGVLSVRIGTEVTWRHVGNRSHDTRAADGLWYSGPMTQGLTYKLRLNEAGEFRYYCGFHADMSGLIIVEP
ncbi:MAG: hypothetical protein HY534_00210 [Chloroflexi bacterium]|nr:hypothetical protein [Chloroflexota bacterium]